MTEMKSIVFPVSNVNKIIIIYIKLRLNTSFTLYVYYFNNYP